jgi:hypothetical protein
MRSKPSAPGSQPLGSVSLGISGSGQNKSPPRTSQGGRLRFQCFCKAFILQDDAELLNVARAVQLKR